MKVDAITFGNKHTIPPNHEEKQNQALAEIYKRVMAGETGPYSVDYYHGKETKITNLSKEKQGFSTLIKNIFKKVFKK